MSRTPRDLDALVAEARQHLVPESYGSDHDWTALDRALEERLGSTPRELHPRRGSKWAVASGVALVLAAAATLVFRPTPLPIRTGDSQPIAASVESTGNGFRILSSRGELRSPSSPLHVGDRLVTGAEAVSFVSRTEAGGHAVAWRVEQRTELVVALARAPLGLTLESGAVEADVTRVAQGEAFVVDVGPVRVAVKGTHLRVARSGDRATVDLTEGTIAIGPIPAAGLTTGKLVTAPAHVEIDLRQPLEVRLASAADSVRVRAFDHDARVNPASGAATPSATVPVAASPVAPPTVVPRPSAGSPPLAPEPSAAAAAPEPRMPVEVVRDAVRACIDKHVPSGPVRVVINSTLTLDVDPKGEVKRARFEPPLSPEVQACASESIYKTRFLGATTERISVAAER